MGLDGDAEEGRQTRHLQARLEVLLSVSLLSCAAPVGFVLLSGLALRLRGYRKRPGTLALPGMAGYRPVWRLYSCRIATQLLV